MSNRNKVSTRVLALHIACALGATATQTSWARQGAQPGAPADPASAAATHVLEAIIVTAQKRSENLVDVPISISAISGESLQAAGVLDVTSLQQIVPGLRVDFSGPFSQPTIRGVGSALLGPGLSSNVATYIDGIVRPSSLTNNVQFDDVEDIQVLKGPQGTLFGRNATGGAILISTAAPTFEPTARARLSYGSYNTLNTALTASGGLSDTVAGSLSLARTESDGFVRNLVTGDDAAAYENWGARGKLLYRPNDAAELLFTYEHLRTDDGRAGAQGSYRGWSVGSLLGGQAPGARGVIANDVPAKVTADYDAAHLKATIDFASATLTSFTAWQSERDFIEVDNDASSVPVVGVTWRVKERTVSQEFNLSSAAGDSLSWVVGGYYFDNRSEWPDMYISLGGAPGFSLYSARVDTQSYALFADVTRRLGENFYLTGGLRYGRDRVDADFQFQGDARKSPSETWDDVTPRLVMRYELSDDSNVYASYSQGYKAGVFNAPGNSVTPVNPEKIDAYEIGFKSSQSRWRFEAAAYFYDYEDLQVTTYTQNGSVLVNAGTSEIYGLDTSLMAQLTDRLSLSLGAAYTHARYVDFRDAPSYTWDPAAGVIIGAADASGFEMQRTPEFQGNLSLNYAIPLAQGELDLSTHYAYQSKVYFDPVKVTEQPAYGILNLRAAWTSAAGTWTVAVFGRNVTDEKYIAQVLPNSTFFGVNHGEPATAGIEFSYRY